MEKIEEALRRFPVARAAGDCFQRAQRSDVGDRRRAILTSGRLKRRCSLLMERGGWSNPSPTLLPKQSGREQMAAAFPAPDANTIWPRNRCAKCASFPWRLFPITWKRSAEIDHEAREEARRLGITQFEMSAGLNDSPKFISALAQIVLQALGESAFSPFQRIHAESRRQLAAPEYRWRLRVWTRSYDSYQSSRRRLMAEPEAGKVQPESGERRNPQPRAAVDATKYVGTPAVGTSKAAARRAVVGTVPSNTEIDRRRRRLVWIVVTGISDRMVPGILPFLSSAHSFRTQHRFQDRLSLGVRARRRYQVPAEISHLGRSHAGPRVRDLRALHASWAARRTGSPARTSSSARAMAAATTAKASISKDRRRGPWTARTWNLAPDGQIMVDTSRLYQWPKGQPTQVQRSGSVFDGSVNTADAKRLSDCRRVTFDQDSYG